MYLDPNAPRRALAKLRVLQQGDNEPFATFFPKFERLMAESMTTVADDTTKLNYLEGALNYKIKEAMINAPVSTSYLEFTQLLHIVGSRLDGLWHKSRHKDKKSKGAAYDSNERGRNVDHKERRHRRHHYRDEDEGDLSKALIVASKTAPQDKKRGERAAWVDKREMRRRQNADLCLRCASSQHYIGDCHLRPARRPEKERSTKGNKQHWVYTQKATTGAGNQQTMTEGSNSDSEGDDVTVDILTDSESEAGKA